MKNLLLFSTCLLLAACGGSTSPEQPEAAVPEPAPEISAVMSAPVPEGVAIPIPEARTTKTQGDTLLLEGRIMGVMHPFVQGRSLFVLGDNATITPCSDMTTMTCETPWDACCDPVEVRKAGVATIQIVDEEGALLKQGLEGVRGLQKLSTVRVMGTVAADSTPESLVVNATAIEVL